MPAIKVKCINGDTSLNSTVDVPTAFEAKGCWGEYARGTPYVQCSILFPGQIPYSEGYQQANPDGTWTYTFQRVPREGDAQFGAALSATSGGPYESGDGPYDITVDSLASQTPCPAPSCP
jgi:hypothetical protein